MVSSLSQSTLSYTSCHGFPSQEFSIIKIALSSVSASVFIVYGVKLTGYALLDPPVSILCIIWLMCSKDQSSLWHCTFLVHVVLCLRWSFASAVIPHPLLCLCLCQLSLLIMPHLISYCSQTFQRQILKLQNT
jgi:hypothetical protein